MSNCEKTECHSSQMAKEHLGHFVALGGSGTEESQVVHVQTAGAVRDADWTEQIRMCSNCPR